MNGENGSLEEMIARVMQNPEIRNMVAAAGGKGEEGLKAPSDDEIGEKLPAVMAMLKSSGIMDSLSGKKEEQSGKTPQREEENRRRLLIALKPYLNPARQDALESLLKMSQLTDLLGTLPRNDHRGKGDR